MGGFTLIGPAYTIRSLAGVHRCRCTGFKGYIPADVEQVLVNQENKTLDIAVLPNDIRSKMMTAHLGDNFNYSVSKTVTKEEQEAKDKQWFTDMSYTSDNYGSINQEPVPTFDTLTIDTLTHTAKKLEELIADREKMNHERYEY